jgi:hypothetical protein
MGFALPGPGMTGPKSGYDYAHVIGRAATVEPCGENISLDPFLPRRGTLVRQLALADWGSDWLVFTLDEPFEYRGSMIRTFLIRARWVGHPIGSDFCPVFLLLDRQNSLCAKEQWVSQDFQFESWAKVEVGPS